MVSLTFRARGGLMVPYIGALDASPRRFVGRRFDPSFAGPNIGGGWPAMPDGETISVHEQHLSEFKRLVDEAALWPGDQETAAVLGVKFDPTFGGEGAELPPAKIVGSVSKIRAAG